MNPTNPTKRSPRKLVARRPVATDRRIIRKWLSDNSLQSALEDERMSKAEIERRIRHYEQSDPFADEWGTYLLELKSEPVGMIHFMWINWSSRNAEVDTFIGPSKYRNSLSTLGFRIFVTAAEIAFNQFGLNKVYAFVYASNTRTVDVHSRLMTLEAHLKNYVKREHGYEDAYFFGMLAVEYRELMRSRVVRKWI